MEIQPNAARPLYHYVAIEAQDQSEFAYFEGTSILATPKKRTERFLLGTVLKKGPLVGSEVSVGDKVMYECQSAHPGQTKALDAEIFGGTPGGESYLIPVYPEALMGTGEIEEEKAKRMRAINQLSEVAEKRWLNAHEQAQLGHHERRIKLLEYKRRGRARGQNPKALNDTAKGSGVVAVVLEPNEESSYG